MKTKLKSFARRHTKGLLACLVAVSLVVAQIPISYAVDELNQLAEEQQAAVAEQAAPESVPVAPDEAEKPEPAEEPAKAEQPKAEAEEVTESTDSAESTEGQSNPADQQSPAAGSDEPVAGATDTAAADQGKEDLGLVEETVSKKVVDAVTYGSNINIPRVVAEQPEGPAHEKKLEANGDGTYKLSLSVTGKSSSSSESTLADVVVVFDVSGSMSETSNGQTRLAVAKSAVNNLAEQLLANNTAGQENVTLSLVKFSNGASTQIKQTSNLNSFKSAVDGLKAGGGTNWEAGLQAAANIGPRSNAKKYVIFVSDGDPTFRTTESGSGFDRATHEPGTKGRNCCNDAQYHSSAYDNAYGTGNSDPHGWNYQAALNVAKPMTNGGADLYCVAAFGNVSNMSKFNGAAGGSGFYEATNQTALNQAFAEIITKISNTATYKNIQITDEVTGLTGVDPNSFEYTLSNGRKYAGGKATYDAKTGTINWNLGEDYKVENGVTATLSFTVWPKQEAYDLVAALNNGETTYEALTEDQKVQIVKVGNGYALKTNKPNPTLTYTQELAKTVNGETTTTYKDGSGTFVNPDPMPLDVAKMAVKKVWKDSTDASARPDSVTLVVTQDGATYKTVTLSAKNNWESSVYVAPGLLVNANAHGADADGILESGHTYAIQERNLGTAYELNTSAIQPMLNGKTTNTITDMVDVLNGNTSWNSTLTATNTVKGSIEVHKTVVGEDGQDLTAETTNTSFGFAVTLTKGNQPATADVVVYNADGTVNDEVTYAFNNGQATIRIKASQYFVVKNIPAGTTYTITEEQPPFGFGFQKWEGENGADLTGTMKGNTKVNATCVNAVQETIAYESADLKIQKIDEQTGKALSNVTFTLTPGTDGSESQSLTTGEAGAVAFNFKGEGTYTLTETTPAGYVENSASWTINVEKGQVQKVEYNANKGLWESFYDLVFGVDPSSTFDGKTNTLTVKNTQKKGTVTVHKFDGDVATSDVPLAGAVFQVVGTTAAGDPFSKEMTTGADGNASLADVPFGTYTLTEVKAPQGYSISAEPQEFTISAGNVDAGAAFTVANKQVLGSIVITKQDATTQEALTGAEFQTTVNGKAVTAKDNGDGTYTFANLPFGTYSITETKAPQGYEVAEIADVTVDAKSVVNENGVATPLAITVADPQKTGTVTITKVDETTNEPLTGAAFELQQDGKKVYDVTEQGKGVYTATGVAFGTYQVVETKAPTGYEIDPTIEPVTVNAQNVESGVGVTVQDPQKTGTLTVNKTDAVTGEPLLGAEFQLKAGDLVKYTSVSGTNGTYTFNNVAFGEYTLHESVVPAGYVAAKDQTVTVSAENVENIPAVNVADPQKTGTVKVTKVDDTTGDVLTGATFKLAGTTSGDEAYESEEVAVNENGIAEFTQVPFGTYTLTEVKAPMGYEKAADQSVVVDAKTVNTTIEKTMRDPQKVGVITVVKTDAKTGQVLEGAEFALMNGEDVVDTQVTGKDGVAKFEGVAFGAYTVVETKAPQGYDITWNGQNVVISATNVEQGETVNVADGQLTGTVTVTKTDAQTKKALAGAEFQLKAGDQVVQTVQTNEEGIATFTNVAFGDYTVVESQAPKGYVKSDAVEDITVNAANVTATHSFGFENDQKTGAVTVTKVDATDSAIKLAGAEFALMQGDQVVQTAKTNAQGIATFEDVAFGAYTVTETKAPQGYNKSAKDQLVTIGANNVEEGVALTFENTRKTGTVTVEKIDPINGNKLAGAVFSMEVAPGEVKTAQANEDGIATFTDVAFGTYQIKEVVAPEGYVLATQPVTVQVDATNVEQGVKVPFENTQATGTVTVTKLDATTNGKLTGAAFALTGTSEANAQVSLTATANGDGTYTFANVPFGTYEVTETQAPTGYEPAEKPVKVVVNAKNVTSGVAIDVKNAQKKGAIQVTKFDAVTNKALEGAQFKIQGVMSDGKAYESEALTTNADGVLTFENVPFGTYTLTEVKAPKGYQITFEPQQVVVNAENVATLQQIPAYDGQKLGQVTITKFDRQTNDKLAGATFTLKGVTDANTTVSETAQDNGDGTYTFTNVPFGTYTVAEAAAPQGYSIDFAPQELTVNASNVETALTYDAFDNQKTATVTIAKTDAQTKQVLAGAEFTLTGEDVTGKAFEQTSTTDAAGNAAFVGVPFGEYTLSETKAPAGYEITFESQAVVVNAQTVDNAFHYDVTNTQQEGTVTVAKTDAQTKLALAGAEFTLAGTTAAGNAYQKALTTNDEGAITFANVPFGTYSLTESKVPQGYTSAFAGQQFELNAQNITKVVEVAVANDEKTGTLELTKLDGAITTHQVPLAGAEFQLAGTTLAGKSYTQTLVTNESGLATLDQIPFGTYTLTETKAPTGYEITFEPQTMTFNAANIDEAKKITALDGQKTGTVTIGKIDAQTKEALAGATFSLVGTTQTGAQVDVTAADNGDGTYTFTNVPFGTYTVAEAAAPQGYSIDFAPQELTVNASNVETALTYDAFDNQKTATVTVAKTDAQTKLALAGAEFTLAGTTVMGEDFAKTLTTDRAGNVAFTEVPFGEYELTESTVPEGYIGTFTAKTVTVNAQTVDNAFHYDVTNTQQEGTVAVTKIDPINGNKLAGAEFTLVGTSTAGNPVSMTQVSAANGVATFTKVPFGTYTLTEVKAPAGYKVSAKPQTVTVEASNVEATIEMTVEDQQKTGTVTVTKLDEITKAKLAGAQFKLTGTSEAKAEVALTATDNGDGTYTFAGVPFGTYQVTEAKAPQGYNVTFAGKQIVVNAANVEAGIQLTAEDQQKTGTVAVTKVDPINGNKLAGAEFALKGTNNAGQTVSKVAVSGENGVATFTEVPFGDYELTETKAPTGYEVSFEGKQFTMDAANVVKTVEFTVEDQQKTGTVTVTKTDDYTGAKLTGATFQLAGTSEAEEAVKLTATDNGDGTYTFAKVPFGTYEVTEAKAPKGYEVTFEGQEVTINAANVEAGVPVQVQDKQKTATVKVTKADETTSEFLDGAEFTLEGKDSMGKPFKVAQTTNAAGETIFTGVPFGTYTLSESKAPTGYDVTFAPEAVKVDASNVETDFVYAVTDKQKTGTVTVTKTDEVTGAKLAGATFMLQGMTSGKVELSKPAADNGDGTYTFANVPFGTYELTETAAPKGYLVSFEGTQVVVDRNNVENNVAFTAEVADKQKTGTVTVTKLDEMTDTPLAGATFQLTGTSQANATVETTATDNGDGTYTFAGVPFGTYQVTESAAPKGYEVTFEGQEVTIDATNVEEGVAIDVTDKQKTGTVQVVKTDEATGQLLAGAEFKLAGKNLAGKEVEMTATTGEDGQAIFEQVPFGTFTVTETAAPKGYEVTFEGAEFTIDANNVEEEFAQVVNVTDKQKTATVTLTKTDAEDQTPLAGATFKLTGKTFAPVAGNEAPEGTVEGEPVAPEEGVIDQFFNALAEVFEGEQEQVAPLYDYEQTATDNGDGTYTFANVPFGTFALTEAAAPQGYEISFPETELIIDAQNVEDQHAYTAEDQRTKVSIPVTKEWVDGNDRFDVRPDAITVNLLADGEQVATAQLTQASEWSTVFEGLDAYKDHGAEAIEYTVEEQAVDHYTAQIDGSVEDGFQVTNTIVYSGFQGDEGDDEDAEDDVRKRKVLSDEGKKSAPQTGDYAPIAGVAALAGIAMVGIALIERRKRNLVVEE